MTLLSDPCRSFDGRKLPITSFKLEIPKSESRVEYYNWDNGDKISYDQWKLDCKTNSNMRYRWRFIWDNAVIGIDDFALYSHEVIDVPGIDMYLVHVMLTAETNMNDYKNVLTNKYNWENLCLPSNTYELYTYRKPLN